MAYVVQRADGRFEIRESHATPAGPRSRTLATFRVLDDEVLAHAESRATRRFDRDVVAERAVIAGARVVRRDPALLARQLLGALAAGAEVPDWLAQALRDRLGATPSPLPDTIPPLVDWLGASSAQRGDALRDLLRMTDRVASPRRRREKPFPRLRSAPA